MRFLTLALLASLVSFCIASTASAHYLWIAVDRGAGGFQGTNIYFEEAAKPGDGFYMDHFLGSSDVWVRTIEKPAPDPIRATEVKSNNLRWMRVDLPESEEYSVDVYGKFGVYEYDQKKVLLHYYSRNLSVSSHDAMHELGRAEQMDLDLVPHDMGNQIEFTLLWQGEPVAGRTIFVRGPKGLRKNVKTDEHGKIKLTLPSKGVLSLRSSVEFATPGTENGEAYEAIRHNITLLFPASSND